MNLRRALRYFVRVVVLPFGTAAVLIAGTFVVGGWLLQRPFRQVQRTLVYHTDHAALAAACRDLWRRRAELGLKDGGGSVNLEFDDPRLPEVIRKVEPHYVSVWPSGVNLYLGGGFVHHGFDAVFGDPAADHGRVIWKDGWSAKQVCDGLWYYAENGVPDE